MEIKEILKIISLETRFRNDKTVEIDDPAAVLEAAGWHGLEDSLSEYLLNYFKDDAQRSFLEKLKDEQIKKSLIVQYKLKELERIVTILNGGNIDFAIIKGFSTSYWMKTENLNAKVYSDYDILIEEHQLEKAKGLLTNTGYVQMESEEKDYIRKHLVWHVSPLKKEPFFIIELHHRFTHIYDKHSFDVTGALKNKVMAQVQGVSFPALNLADSIYLLALHLYQHEYKDITFQLNHHAELVNIILTHHKEIDWEHFIEMVIENHAQFPIAYAFYHINLVYRGVLGESCIPEYVLEKIQPDDFMKRKDMLSHRHMFAEEPFGNWDFQTFHWKLKYGKEWKGGYEARLFGDMREVTLRYYYLFFRHYADGNWEKECRKIGMEYDKDLFF